MKTILMLLFLTVSITAFAQDATLVQLEYFFDADNGVGKNTLLNITSAADGSFPFTASITGLPVGYHKMYIRTKDSNGKWSLTTRTNVEVFTPYAKTSIVSGEYFIDADPGFGSGTPITVAAPDSAILQNFSAVTSALSVGYHKLYIRFKDNLGKWSIPTRRNIKVFTPYAKTNIVNGEYFIDADPGFGSGTPVTVAAPDSAILQNFSAVTAGLSVGYHKLYIRTKDNYGKWSLTTRNNMEVFAPFTKTTILSGEYFIDTDPSYGSGTPITVAAPDSAILQNFSAVTSGLSAGYHKLYGRFKDDFGRWSLIFRRNIEVYKNDTNYVQNAEYFFKSDNGYGNCTAVKIANPLVDGTFSFNIPLSQIPAGADTLFIRVQDSAEAKWSLTALKNISVVMPLTMLSFNVVKQNNIAQLSWQTANEINTSYFNIQRSTDGRSFANIGKIAAKGSNNLQDDYAYVDDDISQFNANRLFYRLQEIDKDGKLTYSSIKMIDVNSTGVLFTIFPNPVRDFINISSSGNVINAQVTITDINGRILYSVQHNFNTGEKIQIPITQFAKQILIVTITSNFGKQEFKVARE